jgi:hypothetical protein
MLANHLLLQNNSSSSSERENHSFRRLMIIHINTKFRLFDFSFPESWTGNKDGGITGFVLSCLQFNNEFGSQQQAKTKFVLQPQHNPISELLLNTSQQLSSNSRQTPTTTTTTTTTSSSSSSNRSSSDSRLSPRASMRPMHERTPTFENTQTMNRKSIKQQSVPTGLGNLGALAQQQKFKDLESTNNNNTTTTTSNKSLLYFVLSPDQIFTKSKLCCALFIDGDDDWLDDAREFTKRIVNQFATEYKEDLEQLVKISEETEDEEEVEQLKLYTKFTESMHTMKLQVLSERQRRKQHDSGYIVNESKHA